MLSDMAARIPRDLDASRAPLTEAKPDRHRRALTARQKADPLSRGYPHLMADFGVHLALSGKLSKPRFAQALAALAMLLPDLPRPPALEEIALVGEREDGMFERVHR